MDLFINAFVITAGIGLGLILVGAVALIVFKAVFERL